MTDCEQLYKALAPERRRDICQYVATADEGSVSLDELTTHLVTREENASNRSQLDTDRFDRVASELYHVHLPKLEEASILEYDHEERVVKEDSTLPVATKLIHTTNQLI